MMVSLVTPSAVQFKQRCKKILAEGEHGCFCVLPRHVDYLAPLVPGILTLIQEQEQHLFATDSGLLLKKADEVMITVGQAFESSSLDGLHETVARRFRQQDDSERAGASAIASLEASFVRRLLDIHREINP